MNAIGGYFELELRKGGHYHNDAIKLNTARNCFEYVLRARQYAKVYIPYYTCEVMLDSIKKLGIDYAFYSINEDLEPVELPMLKHREAFLYTNYFGLKQSCVRNLAERFGNRLIVDNAQAFYAEPIEGIDTFYSARKFFGVADGAYLYTNQKLGMDLEYDVSFDRMPHLLKRIDLGAEAGYIDFRNDEDILSNQDIKLMSKLTWTILSGIDYESVKKKRRENYAFLDEQLKDANLMHLELDNPDVPMVYPYMTGNSTLRQKLIERKVFVATYWPNVRKWCRQGDWESGIAWKTVFLPIDQRYGEEDMQSVVKIIKKTTS